MKTLNSSFKGVVLNYKSAILYENLINKHNFTLKMCEETMLTGLFPYYFTKNFYLVNEVNELISKFQSAGLIDRIQSKYVGMDSINKIEPKPPSAFTYNNIKGFFYLFFYGCALALISFIGEIIFAVCKQRRGKH